MAVAAQQCGVSRFTRRRAEQNMHYWQVQEHLQTYLALAGEGEWGAPAVPAQIEREFALS